MGIGIIGSWWALISGVCCLRRPSWRWERPVEHQNALEPPVTDALGNIDAPHDVLAVLIDDLLLVTHEVIVRVDAAGGHDLGIGCGRLIAADALRQADNALPASGWVDEHDDLHHLVQRYRDKRTALAACNAGQRTVDRWRAQGEGVQLPETRAYVDKVERLKDIYRRAYKSELGIG